MSAFKMLIFLVHILKSSESVPANFDDAVLEDADKQLRQTSSEPSMGLDDAALEDSYKQLRALDQKTPQHFSNEVQLQEFILTTVKNAFSVNCTIYKTFVNEMEKPIDNSMSEEKKAQLRTWNTLKDKQPFKNIWSVAKMIINASCNNQRLLLSMKPKTGNAACAKYIFSGGTVIFN
ncbi:uncharacterized protein LOC116340930 isoform X2 [Contarinia nasturtii]|uniref:uncharacterized protein LOC116340930 isoform X2 n=1 Tax=Contarinia nasturtii TaxID=265458 RepID=UPI0012D3B54A|nr:uncharacterized protein LOC116340930 isoform X2 [Contarinia nasturtii]XP_031623548.1 uncharacterized protein LOC116340930 isoform X2 [Contarinia nasturtii]